MLKKKTWREREKDLSDDIYRIKKGRKDIKQQHEHTETEGTKKKKIIKTYGSYM